MDAIALSASTADNEHDEGGDGGDDDVRDDGCETTDAAHRDDIDDDLTWRVAKIRLEEANTRRFLRARPIKLPYETSRIWIQRNYGIKTRREFMDLVDNGCIRTPYISKDPENYYGQRGEWISWDHYLLGECGGSGGVIVNGNNITGVGASLNKWQ